MRRFLFWSTMKFNRQKFYEEFKAWRGHITQSQVRGLNFLLECIEKDPHIKRLEWIAYMLATIKLETADTYLPIHEYGGKNYFIGRYGGQTRKGKELGNDSPEEGFDYAGKGFVQLTGEDNYENQEKALRLEYPGLIAEWENETGKVFDLTVGDQPNDKSDPQNAMHPKIAYAIMSYGMRNGSFTGHSLKRYTAANGFDWFNARRIINGTDKAQTIADYGKIFYKILSNALIHETPLQQVGALISNTETVQGSMSVTPPSSPMAAIDQQKETSDLGNHSDAEPAPSQPQSESEKPPATEPVVEVQQVKPEVSTDKSLTEKIEEKVSWFSGKIVALPTAVVTFASGVFAYLSSAPSALIFGFFGASGLVTIVYLSWYMWLKNSREKRLSGERIAELALQTQREAQAHELQKLTMESAMRRDLNTIKIVPQPILNSDPPEVRG